MRGEILHYDVEQGIGFISAEDGSRYMFSRKDLMQAQRVGKGTRIDFRPDGQNAREVYTTEGRILPPTSVPSVAPTQAPAVPGPATAALPPSSYDAGAQLAMPERSLWGYFVHASTQGYGDFKRRARRMEYWGFVLFWTIALVVASLAGVAIDAALGNMDYGEPFATVILVGLATLYFLVPGISVAVRRFHDVGLSGWLYLLFILLSVIYIGSIIIFVISLLPSQKHDNKWGPVPGGVRI